MSFWQLYYHLVWATKKRDALITKAHEERLYQYLRSKASKLECITYAIGGTEDHIHLILSIPPKLSISQVVRQLKGSSSHELNQNISSSENRFGWQTEYGAFSLGKKQLHRAVEYVERQKEHHAAGSVISVLEQTNAEPSAGMCGATPRRVENPALIES
ncbi:IS200/IS605 family transposase [Vasconcelosia minhoensis]|uniref:IS200/IS605 family transposase n=1 Tax=Vasconcelosia minhoensis TaxID=3366354 RepID=UPI002AD3A218|nr:IS200/IS605 family transposase [Romeria gracilis]